MKNVIPTLGIILILLAISTFFITKQKSQFSSSATAEAYTRISPEQAVETVRNLMEIRQWESSLNGEESKAVIAIESETDTAYVIHVYENKLENIVTFGWYDVDKKIGNVTKGGLQ